MKKPSLSMESRWGKNRQMEGYIKFQKGSLAPKSCLLDTIKKKTPTVTGEVVDSRIGTGKIQDESGASCDTRK